MAKFLYLFVITLCLAQNYQRALANFEEDDEENETILNSLKLEMADEFQELYDSLVNNYYEDVNKIIKTNNLTLTRVFKFAKMEIADLFDDSFTADECSLMAYQELDDLNEKIKSDVDNCIDKGNARTSEILDDIEQDILKAMQSIIEDFTMKTVKCAQKFQGVNMWPSNCIDFKETMKMKKAMEEAILSAALVGKIILEQVVEDVGSCLKEVQSNAMINSEIVTDEFRYCINEV